MAKLLITYKKSIIGYEEKQKQTVRSLGLRKLHQQVLQPDNQAIRGMVFRVRHLVAVEEVADTYEIVLPIAHLRPRVVSDTPVAAPVVTEVPGDAVSDAPAAAPVVAAPSDEETTAADVPSEEQG